MSGRCLFFCFFALVTIAGLVGCRGGSLSLPNPQPTPTSVIFLESPPSSLAVNAKATIDAQTEFSSVAGASENTEVTYALSCGSANACGTLSTSNEVGAMVYTAPPAVPSGGTVTVTATSVADSSLARTAVVTIVPPIPIAVTLLGTPPALLQVGATFQMHAQIANDVSANPQVTWAVTCGGTACGSFDPTTTGNEVGTMYTAPATIPAGNNVTVTATSVTDTTKSVSASIVITPQAAMLANGTYVFQWSEAGSGVFVTGVLVAQDGAITGGEQDAVYDDAGPASSFQQFNSGSYATTADGNLAITISLEPGETETLNGTLTSNQQGFVGGIDGVTGNGTVELQSSTAAPSGGYAFSLDAMDFYDGSPWVDGIVNVDSPGGISGSGSILDVNGEGTYSSGPQEIGASTVSAADANGRVLFQLNPVSNSALPALYVAGYVVDATHMRLIEVGDPDNSYQVPGAIGGIALAQGASTGKFSAASVVGSSYVFGAEGEDGQGVLQVAGVMTFGAGDKVTGTLNWNDLSGKSAQSPLPFAGSYTVDPTGRVTVTDLTDGSSFTYSLHFYLDANGGGPVLSADNDDVFAGQAFEQQAGGFSAASFSGSYGFNASLYNLPSNSVPEYASAVGPITVTPGSGGDAVSGFADLGAGLPDFAVAGSFTPAANGIFTGMLSGFGTTAASPSSAFTLYLVDSTEGVAIETAGTQLTLARIASRE
jgi:hypothetical protein